MSLEGLPKHLAPPKPLDSKSIAPCYYCGAQQATPLYSTTDIFDDSYELCACQKCEAIYLNPHPSDEKLLQAYDDHYYGIGGKKFDPGTEKILNYFRYRRARILKKALGNTGSVLDIGCGSGYFLEELGRMGDYDLFGVEMPGRAADRAKTLASVTLKEGELEAGDFPAESFDAITLFQVFEHLHSPQETLAACSRLLKPGGLLMMSFPNIDSWQASRYKGDWYHLDPPRNLFFFRPSRFRQIMQERGFSILHERHFSPAYNPFGYIQSILNKRGIKRELLYEYLKGNPDYTQGYSQNFLNRMKFFYRLTYPAFIIADMVAGLAGKGATVDFLMQKT